MSLADFVNQLRSTNQSELDAAQQALDAARGCLAARNAEQRRFALAEFRSVFTKHNLTDQRLWETFGFTSETLIEDFGVKVVLRHKDFQGIVAEAGPIELPGKENPVAEINAASIACLHVILGAFPL